MMMKTLSILIAYIFIVIGACACDDTEYSTPATEKELKNAIEVGVWGEDKEYRCYGIEYEIEKRERYGIERTPEENRQSDIDREYDNAYREF